jgi:hypothetical protein
MTVTNKVAWAYVEFVEGGVGKRRPILLISGLTSAPHSRVYKITSKYQSKSDRIRAKYFEIMDWQFANLTKPSWIDTNTIVDASKLPHYKVIGTLSVHDKNRLSSFLESHS